jgi:hypothetical protein
MSTAKTDRQGEKTVGMDLSAYPRLVGKGQSQNGASHGAKPRWRTGTGIGVEGLFRSLDGRVFADNISFQEAVREAFNAHIWDFPSHYTYLDAISWAKQHDWLQRSAAGIAVSLDGEPALISVAPSPAVKAA